jgi:Protein of unknown function (DUF4230)
MTSSETDREDPAETRRIPLGRGGATRWVGAAIRQPRRSILRTLGAVVAVLLVAGLALIGLRSVFQWPSFGDREIDRSGPAVLTAMKDLSEYRAASGSYQIVIDVEQDARFLPDLIKGKRVIFLAIGSVDAYVDFRKLDEDSVKVNGDRTAVEITLPRAQLSRPTIDPQQSRVLDRDLGVIDRLGGLFSDDPNPQDQQMYKLAEQRLGEAATQVGLTAKAEENTRSTLEKLMRSLGFTSVKITFVDPASGG